MKMTFLSAGALAIVIGAIGAAPAGAQQAQSGTTKTMPAQSKLPAVLTEDHAPPQGFSVVLVLGDMQAMKMADDSVPAAARKALADLKDFLPYKSYRLLDTQFSAGFGPTIISRLRGPEDQDYDLELTPRAAVGGKWAVRFALREPGSGSAGDFSGALQQKEAVMLTAQRNELERKLAGLRAKLADGNPELVELKAQLQETERRLDALRLEDASRKVSVAAGNARDARRAVIDTSFNMDVGETVVVGTSRLKGDKALIALLTAIAPQRKQ